MSDNLKRILLIIGLVTVSALIAWGIYSFFTRTGAPATRPPGKVTTTTPGKLPTAGERPATTTGGTGAGELPTAQVVPDSIPQITPSYYQPQLVKQVITDNISFSNLSQKNNLRYYSPNEGKFYRLDATGKPTELSAQVFYNVEKVTWAPNNDKAVLYYPDGSKIVYNFETQKQVSMPKHWEEFSFSNNGTELAAKSMGLSSDNRWLVTTKDDGTGTRLVEPMGDNADKVTVDWSPTGQVVAFSDTGEPLGADRKEILFVGLNGENFKSAIVEGTDFRPAWSPTGQKLLYSVYSAASDLKPEVWIVDAYGDDIGNNRKMLKLNTWADKCTFKDDNTVFCAVPKELPRGAGMLPEVAAGIYDNLYKIDVRTGLKTAINLDKEYTIDSLSVDSVNNKLYFTSTNQTGVFEVKI